MADGKEPSGAQKMFGDFAPALVGSNSRFSVPRLWKSGRVPERLCCPPALHLRQDAPARCGRD